MTIAGLTYINLVRDFPLCARLRGAPPSASIEDDAAGATGSYVAPNGTETETIFICGASPGPPRGLTLGKMPKAQTNNLVVES
jgi:hypothetical protein